VPEIDEALWKLLIDNESPVCGAQRLVKPIDRQISVPQAFNRYRREAIRADECERSCDEFGFAFG
jgi:hypothetical protein